MNKEPLLDLELNGYRQSHDKKIKRDFESVNNNETRKFIDGYEDEDVFHNASILSKLFFLWVNKALEVNLLFRY